MTLFALTAVEPTAAASSAGPEATAAPAAQSRTFAPVMGMVSTPNTYLPLSGPAHRPRRSRAGSSRAGDKARPSVKIQYHPARIYATPDGYRIKIRVSKRYDPDPDADQTLANYLGSLVHGSELGGLQVTVVTAQQIPSRCGVRAAACYFPSLNRMVIVGESQYAGLPTDFVIAHEYGHRVAQYRRNPPFPGGAFWFGTKRWSTAARVCPQVRRGVLSINGGAYWDFPGEAFAEAYARLHHPGLLRWQFAPSLKPTKHSAAQLRRDVLEPWRRAEPMVQTGTLRPGTRAHHRVNAPLDGRLIVTVWGGGKFTVALGRRGRILKQVRTPNRKVQLTHVVCGERKLAVRVNSPAGGRYRLRISAP